MIRLPFQILHMQLERGEFLDRRLEKIFLRFLERELPIALVGSIGGTQVSD